MFAIKWLNENPALSTMIQVLSTIVAIFAIGIPQTQTYKRKQNEQLDQLIAARNIAKYLDRFVLRILDEPVTISPDITAISAQRCLDRVREIKLDSIFPQKLSESFLDIEVAGAVIVNYISYPKVKIDKNKYRDDLKRDMENIDIYLRTKGIKFTELDDIAYRTASKWSFLELLNAQSDFNSASAPDASALEGVSSTLRTRRMLSSTTME